MTAAEPQTMHTPTPTPWKLTPYRDGDKEMFITARKCELAGGIAIIPRDDRTEDQDREIEANAALIVRAVNSHAALVKALRQVLSQFEPLAMITINGETDIADMAAIKSAKDALAQAGETP